MGDVRACTLMQTGTRTGQQNAPLIQFFYIPQQKVLKKLHEVLHEVYTKSAYLFYDYSTHWIEQNDVGYLNLTFLMVADKMIL